MKRVRTFSATTGVSAFCLYFDDYVVVEFSDTGNAAYVYGRREFDDRFNARLMSNRLRAHSDLKDLSRATKRMIHSLRWEDEARFLLAGLGIRRREAAKPGGSIGVAPSAMGPAASRALPAAPTPVRKLVDDGNRTSVVPTQVEPTAGAQVVPALQALRAVIEDHASWAGNVARRAKLEVIDNTVVGGAVWIVGGPSLGRWLESQGIRATFMAEGRKFTRGRPAWRLDE